jgi:hypothetical protein
MNAQSEPAPNRGGRPLGSLGARGRRQKMIADLVAKLGGNVGPLVMADIVRYVDLDALAGKARAALAAGNATVDDVARLEGVADRAFRRLNLPEPGPSKVSRYGRPEPVPTLQDYWAGKHAAQEEPEEG